MVTIERVDNWELVIEGSDLDANGRIEIEDSQINCALIREIGTDQATDVVFGVRDSPFMTIDSFIAPYHRASNNLNLMRLSTKRGTRWGFTGFEMPLALDKELQITGLDNDKRVYIKGSLFRNVLTTDSPINQYLMSRLVEYPYRQLRPIYFKGVTVPAGLTAEKEYVLDLDSQSALVAWDPSNPKYTLSPPKNIHYVMRNTIQVLWNDVNVPPREVEFRIKHNNVDVKVQPRLDHMFFPPGDGMSQYKEETLGSGKVDPCEVVWTAGVGANTAVSLEPTIKKEGTYSVKAVTKAGQNIADNEIIAYDALDPAVDLSSFQYIGFWIGAVGAALADGGLTLLLDDTAACASPIEEIPLPYVPIAAAPGDLVYMLVKPKSMDSLSALASVGLRNTTGGNITENNGVIIDDVRALPMKLSHTPMEPLVKAEFTGGAGASVSSVNFANGEVAIAYASIPTSLLVGYYAFMSGGGRDIFTLRDIDSQYHTLRYPNKQSYVFKNKGTGTPDATKTMSLYSLAEYYQEIPFQQRIPQNVLNAAWGLLG